MQEQPKSPQALNWWESLTEWFDDFLDLREGMDREGATESIKKGKLMRGTNAWLLVCSIMIASLGLNLNSGAVIIGAMLISPLMNPILGLGLGVATNDREALIVAVRHFLLAIVIALVTSTLYFWITPLKEFTPEIAARTSPNILDGLVALFGGLAGIISVTRADKTNAIPGVAIATALMPPLCVSGYGLASGDWSVAARSFYLFFLNSSIIAVTAYAIIRLLRFPYRKYVNQKEARRSRMLIGLFSALILVPSVFIMLEVMNDFRLKRGIQQFVETEFESSCLEYKYITVSPDSNVLVMELLNRELSPDSTKIYEDILASYKVPNTSIIAIPDNNINLQRLERVQYQISALTTMEDKLSELAQQQEKSQMSVTEMKQELATYRLDSAGFERFNEQLRLAFPDLKTFSLSKAQVSTPEGLLTNLHQATIHRERRLPTKARRTANDRLQAYLTSALQVDTVLLIEY